MVSPFYVGLGVSFAIISGVLNNIGTLMNKKVVNEVPADKQFFKKLIKNGLWLWGLLFQFAFGSVFFIIAQFWVGPAEIPGLMAAGLIVLAIGSVKLLGEKLKPFEIFGIVCLILATTLLGLSDFSVNISINMLEIGFITRTAVFTILTFIGVLICHLIQAQKKNWRAVLLSVESGLMLGLTNFWIGPLAAVFGDVFSGHFQRGELFYFIIACVLLPGMNVWSIAVLQLAFQTGQASNMVPIQQIPIQLMPIGVLFLCLFSINQYCILYIWSNCGNTDNL